RPRGARDRGSGASPQARARLLGRLRLRRLAPVPQVRAAHAKTGSSTLRPLLLRADTSPGPLMTSASVVADERKATRTTVSSTQPAKPLCGCFRDRIHLLLCVPFAVLFQPACHRWWPARQA